MTGCGEDIIGLVVNTIGITVKQSDPKFLTDYMTITVIYAAEGGYNCGRQYIFSVETEALFQDWCGSMSWHRFFILTFSFTNITICVRNQGCHHRKVLRNVLQTAQQRDEPRGSQGD